MSTRTVWVLENSIKTQVKAAKIAAVMYPRQYFNSKTSCNIESKKDKPYHSIAHFSSLVFPYFLIFLKIEEKFLFGKENGIRREKNSSLELTNCDLDGILKL